MTADIEFLSTWEQMVEHKKVRERGREINNAYGPKGRPKIETFIPSESKAQEIIDKC